MKVFGIMVLRNEADILPVNLRHHLSIGIDHFLVTDNGSTDGTSAILDGFSRQGLVEWNSNPGPYRQAEITTELAREAYRKGADWVVPIDADEFWCAPAGSFREVLKKSRAGAIQVEVLNFIQRRDQTDARPEGLLLLTRRAALPVGPLEQVRELVEAREFAYVEMMYSPKFISRASGEIRIAMGNHGVGGVTGPVEASDQILCFHAVLRARQTLEAKVEQGARVAELGLRPEQGWHVRRWLRLAEEEGLEKEWRANSYESGCLDVNGKQHPVAYDPRLRDLLAPYLSPDPAMPGTSDRAALLRTIHEQCSAHQREVHRRVSPLQREVEVQARIISGLQEEMQEKVAECNQVIAALRQELQDKVGQRDRAVVTLQAELQEKVGDRDRRILKQQVEIETKVMERDALITKLQAELLDKIGERDRRILELQTELETKVTERDVLITKLQAELLDKVGERDRRILELQTELETKVTERNRFILDKEEEIRRTIAERDRQTAAFQAAWEDIRSSRLWPVFDALRGKKGTKGGQ